MLTIGLTGGFGAGKSTVAGMFRRMGAEIVDADAIVHCLLENDPGCRRAVGRAFGDAVLTDRGVDRAVLGRIVFSDHRALRRLEKILHPLAWAKTQEILRTGKDRVVVIDAPLLLEARWHRKVDLVVVVSASQVRQIERIQKRMGLSKADVLRRIRLQMPLGQKRKYADYVVDNGGSRADTYRQVKDIWKKIMGKTNQEEYSS